MIIRFKDGTVHKCAGVPVENMIFKDGKKAGWLLSFYLYASSMTVDNVLTSDNITEIKLIDKDDRELMILKYDSINSVRVEYGKDGAIAYIELKRGIAV